MLTMPLPFFLAAMSARSALRRALEGSLLPLDEERVYARNFEVPAGGGVGTARAIAQAYGVFSTGGKELGLSEATLRQLMAPPVVPRQGFRDGALKVPAPFSLGFAKPGPANPFGSPGSFGHPGSGGSFGFADPELEIGYGYVLNGMGTHLTDPRDRALRTAMYRSIGVTDPYRRARGRACLAAATSSR
jgi:CubicO group peptidase (beta-lactamase class C family)